MSRLQWNNLSQDTLSTGHDSPAFLVLGATPMGPRRRGTYALSRMRRDGGQCGDGTPPFLGRRRGWCVALFKSSPGRQEDKEQGSKRTRGKQDGGSCFEVSRPFGLQPRPVFAIGPWPGHCSVLLGPVLPSEWPRSHAATPLISYLSGREPGRELRHVVSCTAEPPRPPQ